MDILEYIKSGVIECYVMGIADEQEKAELLQLRLRHPEIARAIDECEGWFSAFADSNAVPAPPAVKTKLFDSLRHEFIKEETQAPVKRLKILQYLVAASLLLFVISTGIGFYYYQKYKQAREDYLALLIERNTAQSENQVHQAKIRALTEQNEFLKGEAVERVIMPGIKGKEGNMVTVFWNKKSKEVYLYANILPKAPAGKQYQLWALVDGKPVDAGVLENCEDLCKLKAVEQAQAFAITLEKTGGSATPTLDQMYVLGKVKGV